MIHYGAMDELDPRIPNELDARGVVAMQRGKGTPGVKGNGGSGPGGGGRGGMRHPGP